MLETLLHIVTIWVGVVIGLAIAWVALCCIVQGLAATKRPETPQSHFMLETLPGSRS